MSRLPYRSLRGRGAFSRVYRVGDRARYGALTVLVTEGPSGPATVGFVAGKKIGSAAQRNRAKRRLREAAARSALKADTVYVLIAEGGVLTAKFEQLVEWISLAAATNVAEEVR